MGAELGAKRKRKKDHKEAPKKFEEKGSVDKDDPATLKHSIDQLTEEFQETKKELIKIKIEKKKENREGNHPVRFDQSKV